MGRFRFFGKGSFHPCLFWFWKRQEFTRQQLDMRCFLVDYVCQTVEKKQKRQVTNSPPLQGFVPEGKDPRAVQFLQEA
jgi:hypothetical protein